MGLEPVNWDAFFKDLCWIITSGGSLVASVLSETEILSYLATIRILPVVSKNSNGVEDLVGKRGRGEVD
jgi:hypothetical protein